MITFSIDESLNGVFPEPRKSGKYLPTYYKNLSAQSTNNPQSGTAKQCIPFMEATLAGYVIPFWTDIYVVAKDQKIEIMLPDNLPMNYGIGRHEYDQLKNYPGGELPYGKELLKFISPWIIKSPPGVSCLFTSPMNHFETRFKLVDGIVDTDTYYNQINFPFVWTGGDGEFFIEKGTPLAQVFPFVRYNFDKYQVKPVDSKKQNKASSILGTVLRHGYRKYFWHKRKK